MIEANGRIHSTMSPEDAAEHLGISCDELTKLRREGKGPQFYEVPAMFGGGYRYWAVELDAWLARNAKGEPGGK